MAQKKPTQTEIVKKINQNNINYNLLDGIYVSIDNYIDNNTLSNEMKDSEDKLLELLTEAQSIIHELHANLLTDTNIQFSKLK